MPAITFSLPRTDSAMVFGVVQSRTPVDQSKMCFAIALSADICSVAPLEPAVPCSSLVSLPAARGNIGLRTSLIVLPDRWMGWRDLLGLSAGMEEKSATVPVGQNLLNSSVGLGMAPRPSENGAGKTDTISAFRWRLSSVTSNFPCLQHYHGRMLSDFPLMTKLE